MFRQLDELAAEWGTTRTRAVRRLLAAGLHNRPIPPSDPPSEEELLELLADKARMGNVGAIRALLVRAEEQNPQERLIAEFQRMAEDARRRSS